MFTQDSTNISIPFLYPNEFLIEEYAEAYRGRAKVLRLKAIAENCGNENQDLELEALKLAYDEAKLGNDVQLFKDIAEKINDRKGEDYRLDLKWCTEVTEKWNAMKPIITTKANKAHDDFLVDAASYRITAIDACKEAVDIHYSHGEIEDAKVWNNQILRCCGESDDLRRWECIIRRLLLRVETKCYQAAKVVVVHEHNRCVEFVTARDMENLSNASVEENLFADFIYASAMNLSNGLICLLEGNYRRATDVFLDTDAGLGNRFSSLLASHDVGAYGILCAMSISEHPNELKTRVSEYPDFEDYLDSNLEFKELLIDFYSRNYFSLFRRLDHLGLWLSFDIYMSKQFKPICKIIRHNCLINYVQAFSSLTLTFMADTFNMTVEGLKDELLELIEANKIQAEIYNNVLYVPNRPRFFTILFRQFLCRVEGFWHYFRSFRLFKWVWGTQ